MDGSFHAWLEERGPEGCLIDMVDDATNTTWAKLGEQETIWAVADGLRAWVERYGVPLALYMDWKNLYKRAATPRERLRGEEPITQFGRRCAKLGIEIIAASSPQAKGRVERQHGTHQDRLVKNYDARRCTVTKEPTFIRSESICRNTTGASRGWRRKRRTITVVRRGLPNWTGFSDWRASGRSVRTGWCDTTTGFSKLSRGVTMRRRRAKCWSVRDGTAASASNTAGARCAGRRSLRQLDRQ
jgi:hypothetical protein